jgi:hypothetical protein
MTPPLECKCWESQGNRSYCELLELIRWRSTCGGLCYPAGRWPRLNIRWKNRNDDSSHRVLGMNETSGEWMNGSSAPRMITHDDFWRRYMEVSPGTNKLRKRMLQTYSLYNHTVRVSSSMAYSYASPVTAPKVCPTPSDSKDDWIDKSRISYASHVAENDRTRSRSLSWRR